MCASIGVSIFATGSPESQKQLHAAVKQLSLEQLGAGILEMLGQAEQQVNGISSACFASVANHFVVIWPTRDKLQHYTSMLC